MTNPLAPGQGGGVAPSPEDNEPQDKGAAQTAGNPLGAPARAAVSPMLQHFGDATTAAAAQYAKVKEAVSHVASIRKELDGLLALRDTVTSDDLVKAASGVVASGALSPTEMATMLAEAPDGGEALASWVAEKDQSVAQTEAQMEQALAISRHRLGVTAFRQLLGHGAEAEASPQLAPNPNPFTIH